MFVMSSLLLCCSFAACLLSVSVLLYVLRQGARDFQFHMKIARLGPANKCEVHYRMCTNLMKPDRTRAGRLQPPPPVGSLGWAPFCIFVLNAKTLMRGGAFLHPPGVIVMYGFAHPLKNCEVHLPKLSHTSNTSVLALERNVHRVFYMMFLDP